MSEGVLIPQRWAIRWVAIEIEPPRDFGDDEVTDEEDFTDEDLEPIDLAPELGPWHPDQ